MTAEIPAGKEIWLVAKSSKAPAAVSRTLSSVAPQAPGCCSCCLPVAAAHYNTQDPLDAIRACRGFTRAAEFSVPSELHFGSLDSLIRLTEDLQKCDGQLDGMVHRLERQLLELDPNASFRVTLGGSKRAGAAQRHDKSVTEYLWTWKWDDSKYPTSRSLPDILVFLMSMASKNEDMVRGKTAEFNEAKTARSNLIKKEGANLLGRDLVDVFTPDVVKMTGSPWDYDFIMTEHLTTVVIILARGADVEFLKVYETLDAKVVPFSARKFERSDHRFDDKDGNTLWRVVMFRSAVDSFKKAIREKVQGATARDFEYSAMMYKELTMKREQAEESVNRLQGDVRKLYMACWSDAFSAWMHIKAMRIFVESILRFGYPPAFSSFMLTPKSGVEAAARKALAGALGFEQVTATADAGDEGEEFFPYVSFDFIPFAVARS